MVLVDTSVWIDFLLKGTSGESQVLSNLIEAEEDVATCGLIRQEVLQGIRDDLTLSRIRNLLDQTHYLRLEEPQVFDDAAKLYRDLRRKGMTLRSPMDCLIAVIATQHHTPLLHRDRDFVALARISNLKLYTI